MNEIQSASPELTNLSADRAEACAVCDKDRATLNDLVLGDQAADPEKRRPELESWLAAEFPECIPIELAAQICLEIEADEAAMGFPDFRVADLAPDELRDELALFLDIRKTETKNQTAKGEIADGIPAKVPAEVGQESTLLAQETKLTANRTNLEAARQSELGERETEKSVTSTAETKRDELRALQISFDQLRQDHDTVEALRRVIDLAENPETQRRLNDILARITLLQSALPRKSNVIHDLLNRSGLDLTADTISGSFGGFMASVETNPDLNDKDRETLRRIIENGDQAIRTGTEVYQRALTTTVDPDTGETMPLHGRNNKAEVRPGVFAYTETGQNVILELDQGGLYERLDVTGLDHASIGTIAEIFALAAIAHDNGADGFLKHVYSVDVEGFAGQRFDPITLNGWREKLTHLMGAGHDGTILQPADQISLLQTQMRAVSPTGQLLPWEDDPQGYAAKVKELRLDNPERLAEFGRYTRLHHGTDKASAEAISLHLSDD